MNVGVDFSAIRRTQWSEYAVRFVFGGLITALAGYIAKRYGPVVAGLFLAFPAICPATATLIEKHEEQRKHRAGLHGTARGRTIAAVDTAGAAMGSIGLMAFGVVTWLALPRLSACAVLALAGVAWLTVSFAVWRLRKLL